LKFLVHFVGDVHQPLHCADDGDRGGNEKVVRFIAPGSRSTRGRKIKLHALWDHLIEVQPIEEPREFANALDRNITDVEKMAWSKGSAADWAWESYTIAHDVIYSQFPAGRTDAHGLPLPQDYYGPRMRGIAEAQLEKAGIRLAMILNHVLGR
jgi:hypothetical protein